MAILTVEPVMPSLNVPRLHPCSAGGTGPGAQQCGATPASLWHRSCHNGHERDVWICGSHARIITLGLSACRECLDHGARFPAVIAPVQMLLAR